MAPGQTITLRTAGWYGDRELPLDFPDGWQIEVFAPRTPPPLTDAEIAEALQHPVGQPPLRELCRGKSHPLVIVDDLNRPTPADRVLPHLLRHFEQAGIAPQQVTILLAPGTHAPPPPGGMEKKVGADAARHCRLLVHDCNADTVRLGETSVGTPVYANPAVAEADILIGIGGAYPNYTAGFGGGSKLALGVLGKRSIFHLHYRHKSMGGSYTAENPFRRDLDEIAAMMRLNTMITLHVDGRREVVRLACGDHRLYYADAVAFTRHLYSVPAAVDADVVISNTYPLDQSLLFMKMKGFVPLRHSRTSASRVAIAACPEGVGYHGLYPELTPPRFRRERELLRRLRVMTAGEISSKAFTKISKKLARMVTGGTGANGNGHAKPAAAAPAQNPIWLLRPGEPVDGLPDMPGVHMSSSWPEILAAIGREQGGREHLKVAIYPCAPLQCVERAARAATVSADLQEKSL